MKFKESKVYAFTALFGVFAFGLTSNHQAFTQQIVDAKPVNNAHKYPYGKIAFIKDAEWQRFGNVGDGFDILGNLYAINVEDNRQTLVKNQIKVSYGVNPYRGLSPDGKQQVVAYRNYFGKQNVDGSEKRELTPKGLQGDYNVSPSWSPDGKKIVFASGTFSEIDSHSRTSIYVVNTDGSDAKQLTQEQEDDNPVFSPDGRKIAFTRGTSIYVMNSDGSQQRKLTRTSAREEDFPSWSPDGKQIAFQASNYNPDPAQYFLAEIFVINSDGTHEIRLTHNETFDMFPFWVTQQVLEEQL